MKQPTEGELVTPKIRLVRPLGAGGMGSVWLADHLALHTQVVVKFISAELANHKEAIARFEREAAAAAQVKSPHVVQILDHGVTDEGTAFIVMELLEGRDLAVHLEKFGRMTVGEVAEVVAQLCRALGSGHHLARHIHQHQGITEDKRLFGQLPRLRDGQRGERRP